MKARTKFLIGGLLVMSTAGYLMASSARDTAIYYLTPSELETRLAADPSFRDAPMRIGANVVRGSIEREPGGRIVHFRMTDGGATYPVTYRGVPPDTFTDAEDVEVVVTGRMDEAGTFQATELLAKCASRYESVPGENGTPAYQAGGYSPGSTSASPAGAQEAGSYK